MRTDGTRRLEPVPWSQNGLVLARLREGATRGEGWVSLPDLAAAMRGYAVHSRIDDLRQDYGFQIENRTEGTRPKFSWYRLIQ